MGEERIQAPVDTEARRIIARLAEETVPRLIERLMQSELAELEVREGGWRIRLRRAGAVNGAGSTDSEARDRSRSPTAAAPSGRSDRAEGTRGAPARRVETDRGLVASPAVGYFVAHEGVTVGTRVRQGDVIGQIDVLGVSQEVIAPVEGTIGSFEVEPGQAVEFGQALARVESAGRRRSSEPPESADQPVIGQLVEA